MTSSSSTNATPPDAATGTSRVSPGGTWHDGQPVLRLAGRRRRAARARFRLSDESSGNGRDTSMASGVSTGSTASRKNAPMPACRAGVELRPGGGCGCLCSASAGRSVSRVELVEGAAPSRAPGRRTAASCCAGVRPARSGVVSSSSIARLRSATRTMKNSSRFDAVIAANLTRSRSGTCRVGGLGEHPLVEGEPGQLAVDEAAASVRRHARHTPTPAGRTMSWRPKSG